MIHKIKESTKKFRRELKRSIVTAITAAFGFLIALVWKDFITEYVNKLSSINPLHSSLLTAITITMLSVLGILIVSRFASGE
ncbi:DUF5654 family protein [Nanoarchaeota archaeon]